MTEAVTLEILRTLSASGDRVMVTANVGGRSFPLFDSPVSGTDAMDAVKAAASTAVDLGQPVSFSVRRDETAMGVTH